MALSIPYIKLRLALSLDIKEIPEYTFHSSFRGIFGRAMKQIFCIQNRLECDACPVRSCIYRRLFEDTGYGYESYRPYIIRHVRTMGSIFEMEIVIFGQLTEYGSSLMYLLSSLNGRMLRMGQGEYSLDLKTVHDMNGNLLYNGGSGEIGEPEIQALGYSPGNRKQVNLRFITPLRLKHEGKLMGQSQFLLHPILRSIHHRIDYYCRHILRERVEFPRYDASFGGVTASLEWQEIYRKSWRQQQKMSLGGLIGEIKVIDPSAQTVGLLKMGELIQAGKQTTFGLGKYEITKNMKEV